MGGFEERIDSDFKSAMKEGNREVVSVLRMLKASIEGLFIQKKRAELKDEDIVNLVRTLMRRHNESIEQFSRGKRPDLAEKEKRELEILKKYAPAELSQEELSKAINEAISETGAKSKADMGRVMKAVVEKVKGKADGKTINQIVSGILK